MDSATPRDRSYWFGIQPYTYDREPYEALLDLSATMAATMNGDASLDPALADAFAARWRADVLPGVPGYVCRSSALKEHGFFPPAGQRSA